MFLYMIISIINITYTFILYPYWNWIKKSSSQDARWIKQIVQVVQMTTLGDLKTASVVISTTKLTTRFTIQYVSLIFHFYHHYLNFT